MLGMDEGKTSIIGKVENGRKMAHRMHFPEKRRNDFPKMGWAAGGV
jgi:hypothetical protein